MEIVVGQDSQTSETAAQKSGYSQIRAQVAADDGSASSSSVQQSLIGPITLYITPGEDGAKASILLEQAHVAFSRVFAPNLRRPMADYGGVVFEGLSGVRDLSRALVALQDILQNGL